MSLDKLSVGELCRTSFGAPARYLGHGHALAVSVQENDLLAGVASPPTGGEDAFPLPTRSEARSIGATMDAVARTDAELLREARAELAALREENGRFIAANVGLGLRTIELQYEVLGLRAIVEGRAEPPSEDELLAGSGHWLVPSGGGKPSIARFYRDDVTGAPMCLLYDLCDERVSLQAGIEYLSPGPWWKLDDTTGAPFVRAAAADGKEGPT